MAALLHPERDAIQLVDVMHALGHPVRHKIVQEIASGEEKWCGDIDVGAPKSTLTGHWRVLRESGVIFQRPEGRNLYITLRRDDLEARFPGLLDLVLGDT
ncbi:helix-turn-helix transcriptional regulator [Actinomadura fulvescens]|uniref:Helix-turn-helix domain-containing protein n=1 Tax=Actinomadura fulvescens TaxID=46160 RepID=A0ABN3PJ48_9ACTN